MKRILCLLIVATTITLFTGCYYDKEVIPPAGSATCDTTQMSYSGDIVRILNNNGCLGCHTGPAGNGGVNLNTHPWLSTVVKDGRLVRAITWAGPANTHMPKGGNKISACEIAKISAWIKEGALNN